MISLPERLRSHLVAVLTTLVFFTTLASAEERKNARLNHWAWQPLSITKDRNLLDGGIDAFIARRLEGAGLKMSPEADRRTLIRRLSFDLHGLPPDPDDVEAFISDKDPLAYENLVDRMLESHHYGERYARHWLDIAHYADTHGFERDRRRDSAWRYRDYVIDALNQDKPYDQFLREQIAGDILDPENEAAVIATGFLAAGPWDFVGQVETKSPILRRAARALDLDDMLTQVMTSTMAVTINCARCHNHKLDPIPQEEYYRLKAVFSGLKRSERTTGEALQKKYQERKSALTDQYKETISKISRLEGAGLDLADIVGGGDGRGTGTHGNAIDPRSGKAHVPNSGNLGGVVLNQFTKSEYPFVDGVFIADGKDGKAEIPISSTGITVSGIPSTSRKAWDHIRNGPVGSQHSTQLGGIDFTRDGHTLLGMHANAGITFDLAAIRKSHKETAMRFTALLGYFGAEGAFRADAWIFVDGKSTAVFKHLQRKDGLKKIDVPLPETARFLTLIATDGENDYSHDQICFGDPRLVSAAPKELSTEDQARLVKLKNDLTELERQLNELREPSKFYGVVPLSKPEEVLIQPRGDPESETGNPVTPGTLHALQMLSPDLGSIDSSDADRRRALAQWITHPDNPLTPRVIVNRMWHWHFGQGIVNTPSDFGRGGDTPSHPELLDWLAAELVRNDWSMKAIHRLILNSKAYKQRSRFSAEAVGTTVDARNRLLWRQNPRRIEAESVRDSVLTVSGKLNLQRGGPGFEDFTYKEAYAPEYTYITADEPSLWRRSIYRYIVRTTPDRFLTTLDCPDPANFTPKRLTTTTPLQSLALYNNDFMLRQARYFAERVATEAGKSKKDQVIQAMRLAFGRNPNEKEIELGIELIQSEGLFTLCRSLFNANEFVYVD